MIKTTLSGIVYKSEDEPTDGHKRGYLEVDEYWRKDVALLLQKLFNIFNYSMQGPISVTDNIDKAVAQEKLVRVLAEQLLGSDFVLEELT
jgi:hypothetical protein